MFLFCVALVCLGMSDLPVKKKVEARRALSKIAEVRFPDTRLFPLNSDQDATLLLRHLGSQKQRKLGFRSRRSHLLAQRVTFSPNSHSEGSSGGPSGLGTLCVSGYVRGRPLRVDRLVHISGHGDFQLSQIDAPSDPLPLNLTTGRSTRSGKGGDVDMQVSAQTSHISVLLLRYGKNESRHDGRLHLCHLQNGGDDEAPVRVLMKADPSTRESLQTEAEVDPMEGEQTWPTESELLEAEGADAETSALS